MKKVLKLYLSCISLFCFLFASQYESLLLIEFDNLDKNKKYDYLRHHLPDLIKNDSVISSQFSIEYAGKIEPFLNGYSNNFKNSVILLGEYSINGNTLEASYSFLDMNSWSEIYSKIIKCKLNDEDAINNVFLKSYTESIQYINGLNISNKITADDYIEEADDLTLFDKIYNALDDFVIEADLNYSWDELNKGGSQYGDRYYKDFDKNRQEELVANSKTENTDKLMSYIDKVLSNPYNVNIGDIKIDYYGDYDEFYMINVPVSYSIKNNLIEDLFQTLPNETSSSRDGTMMIKFYNSDFSFPDYLVDKFSRSKYQVLPVLFFSDENRSLKNIYIDTWDEGYNNKININSIDVESNNSFYPLFAITPGKDNLQINLDLTILDINYSFIVPSYDVKDYSKIAVKFLLKEKLDGIYESHNKKL